MVHSLGAGGDTSVVANVDLKAAGDGFCSVGSELNKRFETFSLVCPCS